MYRECGESRARAQHDVLVKSLEKVAREAVLERTEDGKFPFMTRYHPKTQSVVVHIHHSTLSLRVEYDIQNPSPQGPRYQAGHRVLDSTCVVAVQSKSDPSTSDRTCDPNRLPHHASDHLHRSLRQLAC